MIDTTSGSVWFREVETALMRLVKNSVRVYNTDGGEEIPKVLVMKPEKEYNIVDYPCVTILNTGYNPDRFRSEDNSKKYVVGRDVALAKCTVVGPCKPYKLNYQISFWSTTLTDLDEMTRRWAEIVDIHNILEVTDTQGNIRYCNMFTKRHFQSKGNVENKDSKRIFRRLFNYEIWVELDNPTAKESNMVVSTHVHR